MTPETQNDTGNNGQLMEKTSRFTRAYRATRRTFIHNWGLKWISLVLAFFLWYGITGGPKSERTVITELDITNYIPDGYALSEPYNSEFEVRLSGRDNIIRRLSESEVFFSLSRDVIEAEAASQRVRIKKDDVVTRNGLTVESVTPSEILIVLDSELTRERPVQVAFSGVLPEGLRLHNGRAQQVEPSTIEISGAKSLVEQHEVLLAAVNLDEINVTRPAVITRRTIIEPISLLTYETREVEVSLDIVEVTAEKEFRLGEDDVEWVGLEGGEPDPRHNLAIKSIRVDVKGPSSWISGLQPGDIFLQIDVSDMPKGEMQQLEVTADMVRFRNPHSRQDELVTVTLPADNNTVNIRMD